MVASLRVGCIRDQKCENEVARILMSTARPQQCSLRCALAKMQVVVIELSGLHAMEQADRLHTMEQVDAM